MPGPVDANAFVCLCVAMLYSNSVFLCVPYLAGINWGGRLERVEGV